MDSGHNPGSLQRQLVLVAGVGRSGTSVFTGILGQLGFRVPQPEVQANDTNPRGFGEPQWVVDFHTRLLRERRVTVFDSRPEAWTKTAEAAADDAVYNELRAWLRVQFVGAERVVVKDPRIGWFLPLWSRCAEDLDVSTSFVTMLRHPAEILNSARKWYGTWQADASRATSWLNGMLETEFATRGAKRAFVRYEDLLQDWSREMGRVGDVLDLDALKNVDRSKVPQVDEFVDPALHRSSVDWSNIPVPSAVQSMAEDVWKQFTVLADPGGDNTENQAVLDASREAYHRLYAEAEAIAQCSIIAVKPRKGQVAATRPAKQKSDPASSGARRPRGRVASLPARLARRVPQRYRRRVPPSLRRRAARLLRGGGGKTQR